MTPEKHEQAKEDFEKILEGKNVTGITERALALRFHHSVCALCCHELWSA